VSGFVKKRVFGSKTPPDQLEVAGRGTKLFSLLSNLGIRTAEDLLRHFPYRYDDFSRVTQVRDLCAGQTVAVEGVLKSVKAVRTWKSRMQLLEVVLDDGTGTIRAIWFNQLYLLKTLLPGSRMAIAGKVYEGKKGIYFANPAHELLDGIAGRSLHTRRLVPVYRETRGLTSRWIRILVDKHLESVKLLRDALPKEVRDREGFMSLAEAMASAHFPKNMDEAEEARRRFRFEELFYWQMRFALERRGRQAEKAHAIAFDQTMIKKFVDCLPFKLTDGQRKTAWQILQDISKQNPMQRLVEGDVGSGKTIIAFLAVLETVKAGFQAMLMAPTEVLVQQHFANAKKILAPYHVKVGLATGTAFCISSEHVGEIIEKKISRAKFITMLNDGEIQFAIGTHALISAGVSCKDLALAIVDEQHRFGVEQRARLVKKSADGISPHFLSMSATPIPRTLALGVYGDLDISRITELPPGRQKIETRVVLPPRRNEAYAFMRSEVEKGRQIFVICPRIEQSSVPEDQQATANSKPLGIEMGAPLTAKPWSDVRAVKEEFEKLSKTIFPDLRVAMLHGKMKAKEKESVMKKFAAREFDIIVSTSVIEVGIDVPNATVMAIEGADRFGLATLHQFRGRVGRGEHKSYCLLLSDSAGAEANARLRALITARDGFELAQIDLELRGPGQFIGTVQSGLPDIAMEALRNPALIENAREDARRILEEDGDLKDHPLLAEKIKTLGERVHGE
jgi:ATP-dependent DNA helicase RecG